MALDVYFIRHAQSEGNLGLKTASHEGIVLTELGHAQAQTVADCISGSPSIIAMSAMVRAIQTSETLRRKFPQAPTEILPIHEFTYLSSDKWNGTTSAERKPAIHQYWENADPHYKDSAESESFADLVGRAELTQQWLSLRIDGPVYLISHEIFIHAFIWRCLAPSRKLAIENMSAFRRWQQSTPIANASITHLQMEGGRYVIPLCYTDEIKLGSHFTSHADH